jgi:SAM-dependent methyltransferase
VRTDRGLARVVGAGPVVRAEVAEGQRAGEGTGYFAAAGPVRFETASITAWEPAGRFDLVTCVHGLHYVGDKLGALLRAASWLADGGVLVANFDGRASAASKSARPLPQQRSSQRAPDGKLRTSKPSTRE